MHRKSLGRIRRGTAWRWGVKALPAVLCLLFVGACGMPGSVKPTVKIGLSAPFEGRDRDLGYEALYAVQLAVRERNADGGISHRFLVELVALNDLNEAGVAAEQARKMAVDPDVLGVLGGLSAETANLAWDYNQLGLAYLAPDVDITSGALPASIDADFAERYATQSGGAEPGATAVWAYSAANLLMDAMDEVTRADGHPTRSRVDAIIRQSG